MREIWVKVEPWNKDLVTTALEAGASGVLVPDERIRDVKALVVVKTTDWEIIPLENLVARTRNLFVEVSTLEDARVAAGILERGVDGLVVSNPDPMEVREIIREMLETDSILEISSYKIEAIRPVGMGDRVCVDTCSLMGPGEGILVGNSSQSLFLVQAEALENPYVSPRPFRVNAGAVHAYVRTPGGKTRYLSELHSGDEVLGVNYKGEVSTLVVGRATIILQNAETIRLMGPTGDPVSILELHPGDEILGYGEEGARHFGHRIREQIVEA